MNQMLEAWKGIPDLSDDGSPRPVSNSSSKGNFTSFSTLVCRYGLSMQVVGT